jgi:formylglycine-generating enzyme
MRPTSLQRTGVCLALLVSLLWSGMASAELPVSSWCSARCGELYNRRSGRPKCKRYELEFELVDGKSVQHKRFFKPCMKKHGDWGRQRDQRDEAAAAFEDVADCEEWCGRVARFRNEAPLTQHQDEIWHVLENASVCDLSAQDLEDLSRIPVVVACRGMVLIPPGPFAMGCNSALEKNSCQLWELPFHQVSMAAYYIDRHEVTVAGYTRCIESGHCSEPESNFDLRYYNWGGEGRGMHPINGVTWHQADAYCRWQEKGLCTEAQWEKGARGDDGRRYPWGDGAPNDDLAVMDSPKSRMKVGAMWPVLSTTSPVCQKPGGNSPYGLCDMAGNVWEWVADWFDPHYYSTSPGEDPRGPGSGIYRVIRGGRYHHVGFSMRASARSFFKPADGYAYLGFRCCAPVWATSSTDEP